MEMNEHELKNHEHRFLGPELRAFWCFSGVSEATDAAVYAVSAIFSAAIDALAGAWGKQCK